MKAVIPLASATVATAGPKMGRLGELIRRGGTVPDGFVIPAAAGELTEGELRAEIDEAYQRLCGDEPRPVAVRSSAMDEDGATASFAGVYESFLGVVGVDEIMTAVRACRAAANSERAEAYRERAGGGGGSAMAVGVMLMVPAQASGVAFTVDPVTGRDDRYIIEATVGFGEPVVQGVVTPDRIEVAAEDGRIMRYEAGDIRLALLYRDGRMAHVDLPENEARTPALNQDNLASIYASVKDLAQAAGHPVDCEWVLDDSGLVWVVQWRAVTALPDCDEPEWDPAEYAARYAFRSG